MPWKTALQQQIRILRYSLLLAIRSMRHRSFRTFLTVLGILIGITTFTALMSIGVGMRTQIYTVLNQFSGASMIVMSKISSSRPAIPAAIGGYLEEIPGINYTVGVIEDFVDVNGESVIVTGIDPQKMEFLLGLSTRAGMSLTQAAALNIYHACVIDEQLQQTVNAQVNDTLLATSSLTGTIMELYIVGIVDSLSMPMMSTSGMCYTTLETMQEILVTTNVLVLLVGLDEGADAQNVKQAITAAYPEADVITEDELLAMMDQIVGIINGVLLALSAISLVVGGLMIMNTMMMSVLERTREIGIIKSIGAKRSHVLTIFLTEAFIISIIGGLLGSLAAIGGVIAISSYIEASYGFQLPYSFDSWIFIVGMLLAVGIGMLSGFYPSWQASSIKPVQALRYE
jgi:putative ABC transport system permease protein